MPPRTGGRAVPSSPNLSQRQPRLDEFKTWAAEQGKTPTQLVAEFFDYCLRGEPWPPRRRER